MDTNFFKHPYQIIHITGNVFFKSKLSILEVGKVIGDELFGGLEFGGLEKYYFEEVPGIIIAKGVLGLQISIQEGNDIDDTLKKYVFCIIPIHGAGNDYEGVSGKLDNYLKSLFKSVFKENENIQVIESDE